jgi:two-component system OmpR family response regulator
LRVLLVEDDAMIGGAVEAALKDAAYAVDWARSGPAAQAALDCHMYDLVLLDLGLPGTDGAVVLKRIRGNGNPVPLLIVTARDGLEDRLNGLDAGADDYLVKPFDMAELLARMRAILRRKAAAPALVLTNGIVSLDPLSHEARTGEGIPVTLSNREFALLQALLIRPGTILSRADLEDRIYGWGQEVESNAVEFLIHTLRRKLGITVIRNVRGVGWMVSKGD